MNLVFLFPGSGPYEALDNWVFTIGRHTKHEVYLTRKPPECKGMDCAFVLTEARSYPKVHDDIEELRRLGVPFGVVHNNEAGAPPPGDYPSFVWTKKGQERLERYSPVLLRQPVLPAIVPPHQGQGILVGTFGHVEPKKQTFEMNRWAKKNRFAFVAVGPDVLAQTYDTYMADLKSFGCEVILHPWMHQVEMLAPLLAACTHLMFVLTDAKKGSGGSPTSPRFAGFFNRPVIVVDDEETFLEDDYYVYESLEHVKRQDLAGMKPPTYDWSPDAYLDALAKRTLNYWKTHP